MHIERNHSHKHKDTGAEVSPAAEVHKFSKWLMKRKYSPCVMHYSVFSWMIIVWRAKAHQMDSKVHETDPWATSNLFSSGNWTNNCISQINTLVLKWHATILLALELQYIICNVHCAQYANVACMMWLITIFIDIFIQNICNNISLYYIYKCCVSPAKSRYDT